MDESSPPFSEPEKTSEPISAFSPAADTAGAGGFLPKPPEPPKWFRRRDVKIGAGALIVVAIVSAIFFSRSGTPRETPRPAANETYTLVRDTVSKSAAIALALPKGVSLTPNEAADKVTFEPALPGKWLAGGNSRELLFEPEKPLSEGSHYTVSLETKDGVLSKDFLADEDPRILAVFPREGSEAPEQSEVTIVFNRPMVPLTTLDTLAVKDVPVVITPATEGVFKWTSTRNLQFIPKTRLVRSARYRVEVKEGLTSVEGLPVRGITHSFTTRPLRFDSLPLPDEAYRYKEVGGRNGTILYHEPFVVRFNQPVDLLRTKREIAVKQANGRNAPVIIEYGTRTLFDEGKERVYTDTSALAIYGEADRNGRPRFWDFATSYSVSVGRAYPLEGDIVLEEGQTFSFFVPEVIAEMSATSKRSRHAAPDLFDPAGKLVVRFYEGIDKDASDISAPHLRGIAYGEKCKLNEYGEEVRSGNVCEKEPDKSALLLSFDPDAFGNGEKIPVTFRKLVNMDGVSLIPEPILKTIVTFPKLRIAKTLPGDGATGAGLTELKLCTNTPLKMPDEESFYRKIQSNPALGKWNWYESFRVQNSKSGNPCAVGEFESTLRYGLIPESEYTLSLQLEDDFGQTAAKTLSFTSGKIAGMYRRFSHLQKAYNVTSPERTKLVYGTENLEYVNLHICKTDALTMVRYLNYETKPAATTPGGNLSCLETWTKRIELPKRYFTTNFLEFDLKEYVPNPLGHYILTWSHPEYRRETYNYRTGARSVGEPVYERTFLTATNLAVQEKKMETSEHTNDAYPPLTDKVRSESGGNLYWVTRFGTLLPVEGASVNVYREGGVWAAGGTTNAEGIARTPVAMLATAAIVTAGEDSAIVSSETDKFQWAQSLVSAQKTYLYTDRPIYRPGEEVFIKGLYRVGYDGNYEIVRNRKAAITVYDSQGETVTAAEADISPTGTFMSRLLLPKGAPLGMYRIEALGGYGYFEVEEYAPAAFKVDVTSPKEEYIAGETLALGVNAAYYFGVPLKDGEDVEFSFLAQDYYFDRYSDGYFQFGKGWYYGGYGGYGDRFLLRGKTKLNAKGEASVELPLDFENLFKGAAESEGGADRSKIITVNVTVKNRGGQSVSARKSFIVHRGAMYVGTNLSRRYFGMGEENKILLKTVDTNGKPISTGGVEVTVYKVVWESYRRQEVDGRFYYRSERKREFVKKFSMRTDASGDDEAPFSIPNAGEYELEAATADRSGNRVVSVLDFYVYGEGVVSMRQNNNETLELAVDQSKLKVGDTANIVIKSPFPKGKALMTIERGRIFEYRIIDVDQSLVGVAIPIKEAYLPNVYVSVMLLSPRPEIKYGQANLTISAAEKELSISVQSDKKAYLPGEKVRLAILTKDSFGRPVPAEVSIAVADLSVLALKGNPKKNPIAFFYAGFPLGVSTASNVKNILYEAEVPAGTKGGGGGDEDLARKKRGDFRSTAFWQGVVQTDGAGRAEVTFTLPDNLTTWQSEAVGITPDTKTGAGYGEFAAKKSVMVVPLKPRFIVAGDTFMLGAQVFNQTDEAVRFNIKIESETLDLPGAKNAFEKINPGESVIVYFDAKAPGGMTEGEHSFTLSANGNDLLDSVEERIAIKKNDTYESVATSFSTSKERAREFVFLPEEVVEDKGTLTISANATLAMYLEGALEYLFAFPYGCSEQLASKLSSVALMKRAYAAKNAAAQFDDVRISLGEERYAPDDLVHIGLSRLIASQTYDGGFAYYPGMPSDAYLSVHVLNTLFDLRKAGYAVETRVMEGAARFVANKALYDEHYRRDRDFIIIAAYALERGSETSGSQNPFRGPVTDMARAKKFIREESSNLSLGYLALILSGSSYDPALRDEVFAALENRLTIDGRGAFMKTGSRSFISDFYETPIKDTSLLLRAWVRARKEHALTDKVLRWLLKSRSKDGSWGGSNNTLSAVEALTEYLEWKKESDSEFELSVFLNEAPKKVFTFNRATNEETATLIIPVKDIAKGEMHAIDFVKKNLNDLANTFYYDLALTYFLPIDAVPARDEGFSVERAFFALDDMVGKQPVHEAKVGDILKGVLRITVPKERRFVAVEDFIPAGTELVNFRLSTEDQSLQGENQPLPRGKREGLLSGKSFAAVLGIGERELPDEFYSGTRPVHEKLYADAEEIRDDRLFLFRERLPAGVYEYEYFVRALVPGTYHHLPAVVSEMYFPEHFGRTNGDYFTVTR